MLSAVASLLKPTLEAPTQNWIASIKDETRFTQDIWRLEQYEYQLLFVYNEWMAGHSDHEAFADETHPVHLGSAFTKDLDFTLYRKNMGRLSYPIAIKDSVKPTTNDWFRPRDGKPIFSTAGLPSRIKGELYAVRPQGFIALDKAIENTVQFKRYRLSFVVPYRKITKTGSTIVGASIRQIIKAWIYIGVKEYWGPLLDNGYLFSPVQKYTTGESPGKIGEYYHYAVEENRISWSPKHHE